MTGWGMVAIGTNYTHAQDPVDTGLLPQGEDGASDANVLRANGVPHELRMYTDYDHREIAADAGMLERVRQWYRTHGVLAN
jgi:hypothetical protein